MAAMLQTQPWIDLSSSSINTSLLLNMSSSSTLYLFVSNNKLKVTQTLLLRYFYGGCYCLLKSSLSGMSHVVGCEFIVGLMASTRSKHGAAQQWEKLARKWVQKHGTMARTVTLLCVLHSVLKHFTWNPSCKMTVMLHSCTCYVFDDLNVFTL